jgi:hypothetical protein
MNKVVKFATNIVFGYDIAFTHFEPLCILAWFLKVVLDPSLHYLHPVSRKHTPYNHSSIFIETFY